MIPATGSGTASIATTDRSGGRLTPGDERDGPGRGGTVLAVDIGGTKMAGGLVTPDGRIHSHRRVATPRTNDPEVVFGALAELLSSVLGSGDPGAGAGAGSGAVAGSAAGPPAGVPLACGVGCGGPMRGHGALVSPINIPSWRDFPLRDRMEDLTGMRVVVDNDAKALALGEGRAGSAVGERNYVAMVVSTGIGGGIVVDGRLVEGASGNAGHIGHVTVEPDGRTCGCGARGCLEAEASGTAIEAMTGRPAAEAPPEVRRRTGTLVGRVVASVVNLLDLRLAVVAGSVAVGFGDEFLAAARDELAARTRIEFARGARLVVSTAPEETPLLGAAALVDGPVAVR